MGLIRAGKTLTSLDAVVDAFGGSSPFRERFEISLQQLSNWRAAGTFPAVRYVEMTEALAAEGLPAADPALWGMKPGRVPVRRKARRS